MFNFKKIASVLTSAVMLSSTIGFAAAASYPSPFVVSGAEDVAIVVGLNADVSDSFAAIDIQDNLNALTTGSSSGGAVVSGTAWQAGTSADKLELNESLRQITTYIDKSDLPILEDGSISNEKGTATYSQYLYFEDVASGSSRVSYQEDDDENVGLFWKIASGNTIARYVMDFSTNLESDISTSTLEDIDDEEITIMGKTYTITKAENATTGAQLTLMSGADKVTVANGEEVTAAGKTISVVVSSATQAQFTIDGETTDKLNKGDTYRLEDGTYLGVADITYQGFSGGLMQSTIYVGADKIELFNGSSMTVNAETISDAAVTITSSISGGDIAISEIAVNMTAEDDLYIPEGGKLTDEDNLDKPGVLIGQNWNIEYKGLDTASYEEMSLKKSTDTKIKLAFENYDGDKIDFYLLWVNGSGVFGGESQTKKLVLDPTVTVDEENITKNSYFILNTADPVNVANDARSFVVKYKGSDKSTDTSPKVTLEVLGKGESEEALNSDGTFDIRLGGTTFNFNNTNKLANDGPIRFTGTDYGDGTYGGAGAAFSQYLRTKNNALINITDLNASLSQSEGASAAANWVVTLYTDDTDRDGDNNVLTAKQQVFKFTYSNSTGTTAAEVSTSVASGPGNWISDPDDNTKQTFVTPYGVEIEYDVPSSSPASITAKIPDSAVVPLVYISSGDIVVTPGSSGGGGNVMVVKDNEVSSVNTKNLIVVGGSCINTVAAKILGSDSPLCGADFTAKTEVGAGEYIIKTVESPYASDKVAMLVAGYEKAQTVSAVAKVLEGVTTDVDTSQVYPIAAAE